MDKFYDYKSNIQDVMVDAGRSIMAHRENGFEVVKKPDGSPVTNADGEAEKIIISSLKKLYPNIPIVSEETSVPDVRGEDRFWLLDPLDGTREFIKGTDDFTINLGLIENGVPVFGMVYLPATQDMYYGGKGIGTYLNDNPISIRPYDVDQGLCVVGRKSHPFKDAFEKRRKFLKGHKVDSYVVRGSSLKFCMVADGQAHIYPRFVPTYEWDTAAAHAILLEAGGDILDFETRERLQYGKFENNYLNSSLLTATNEVLEFF